MAKSDASAGIQIGTRLRNMRLDVGLKQAELAQKAGISPTYLNLIEHNRRRIAGKRLQSLANALGVDPTLLAKGAEGQEVADLQAAIADMPDVQLSVADIQTLIERYPNWANALTVQHAKIQALEAALAEHTDRLAYDPDLAKAVNEVLATAASIRATSAILVEPEEMDPGLRRRFQDNVHTDAQRLAEASQDLARSLERSPDQSPAQDPKAGVTAKLATLKFHLAELEGGSPETVADLLQQHFPNPDTQTLAAPIYHRYQADALAIPLPQLQAALAETQDPATLAQTFHAPLDQVFRRLAALPGRAQFGLVVCSSAGVLTRTQSIPGFDLSRPGAACGLWPLFTALQSPGRAVRRRVEIAQKPQGLQSSPTRFQTYAIATAIGPATFNQDPFYEATMLIAEDTSEGQPDVIVGTTCRLCPKAQCPARTEPSRLIEGL